MFACDLAFSPITLSNQYWSMDNGSDMYIQIINQAMRPLRSKSRSCCTYSYIIYRVLKLIILNFQTILTIISGNNAS